MAEILHFYGLHKRAYIIRPNGYCKNQCEVIASGEAVDPELLNYRGTARYLEMLLRERGRGVPVIVRPECCEVTA